MSGSAIDSWGGTHVGRVRKQNEDDLLTRPEIGLWAVADGMGGHDAGNVASAIVIDHLRKVREPDSAAVLMRDSSDQVGLANAAIRELASARQIETMGTTVAVLLASGAYYACLWSGDSRIYLVRARQIVQLTRDHSELQEMLDSGLLSPNDARNWPRRNIITRAVGVFDDMELDVLHGEIEAGDTFVLCSDGLTAHVEDSEIADHAAIGNAEDIGTRLIATVLERGAQDNVTVVVVRFPDEGRPVVPRSARVGTGQDG